jgi:peptidoglycan-N-acetylglucosamine deacetylase
MTSAPLKPIPDGLVLLSFDDGNKSDLTNVAPVLREYGFGATFFITEGLGFLDGADGGSYLSWDDVRSLQEPGFEIENHTGSHPDMTRVPVEQLPGELTHIQDRCLEHGIPAPITFCYPSFQNNRAVVDALAAQGFVFARRGAGPEYPERRGVVGRGGRGPAYDPHEDHPLLIPTTGNAGPGWTLDDLVTHGGVWETSIMMYLHPDLVQLGYLATDKPDEPTGVSMAGPDDHPELATVEEAG